MGLLRKQLLADEGRAIYQCRRCGTDFVLSSNLLSSTYRSGRHSAFLFRDVVNVSLGELHSRAMTSGVHAIQNIYCCECGKEVGWMYNSCEDAENEHKIGCFILVQPYIREHTRGGAAAVLHCGSKRKRRATAVEVAAGINHAAAGHVVSASGGRPALSASASRSASGSRPFRSGTSGAGTNNAVSAGANENSDSQSDSDAMADVAHWINGLEHGEGGSHSRAARSEVGGLSASAAGMQRAADAGRAALASAELRTAMLMRLRAVRAFVSDSSALISESIGSSTAPSHAQAQQLQQQAPR